jgi:hypothetical protein
MMDFSDALKELKKGEKLSRKGWNGKKMFVYLVKGSYIDEDFLHNEARKHKVAENGFANFNSHIDMKTANGSVCVGWLASQTDLLAEDWIIIDD